MSESSVSLLCGARALLPAMVETFDAAERSIYLETYLFNFERQGGEVALALARAAQRGVAVHVLIDGAGTGHIEAHWQSVWQQAGVQFYVFSPLDVSALFERQRWRRLHRKLCVVDESVAFCGGINILDDVWNPAAQAILMHPRLDYALRITGPLAMEIDHHVRSMWRRVHTDTKWMDRWTASRESAWHRLTVRGKGHHHRGSSMIRLVLRDNFLHRFDIEHAYLQAITQAQTELVLACAFFFPAGRLLRALIAAAGRGVRVRLLLQGHYEYWLPYRAGWHLYGRLLAAGVEIYEYQKSFLHAKVAVIDQNWLTVGSSNLDPLSLLLAREANVVLQDRHLAQQLTLDLSQAIACGAQRVQASVYGQRSVWQRVVDAAAAAVLRFGVFLTGNRY